MDLAVAKLILPGVYGGPCSGNVPSVSFGTSRSLWRSVEWECPLQPELNVLAANSGIYRRSQLVLREWAITRLPDPWYFRLDTYLGSDDNEFMGGALKDMQRHRAKGGSIGRSMDGLMKR